MAKLSKEQINNLVAGFGFFSRIQLLCDGYKVTLQECRSGNKIRVSIYINGKFEGKWLLVKNNCDESKFFLPRFFTVKSPKIKRNKVVEVKERVKSDMKQHDFASAKQALNHINKVCDDVKILEGDA